jgi:hypothetical protein
VFITTWDALDTNLMSDVTLWLQFGARVLSIDTCHHEAFWSTGAYTE